MKFSPLTEKKLEQALRLSWTLWAAMLFTPLLLSYFVFTTTGVPTEDLGFLQDPLTATLIVCAAVLAYFSRAIPGHLIARRLASLRREPLSAELLRSQTVNGRRLYEDEDIAHMLQLREPELSVCQAAPVFAVANIFQWVILEGIVVFAFVWTNVTRNSTVFVIFLLISLAGFAATLPSRSKLTASRK